MTDISKLNKTELKSLLKDLKLYSKMKKELWKRWVKQYESIKTGIPILKVEYFSDVSKSDRESIAKDIYKKVFSIDNPENIEYKENINFGWWIRIYRNNDLVDMSFNKIEQKIKK